MRGSIKGEGCRLREWRGALLEEVCWVYQMRSVSIKVMGSNPTSLTYLRRGKERTSDREVEERRRREIEKKKKRGNNEQRACKGYSRIYYIDIYSLF